MRPRSVCKTKHRHNGRALHTKDTTRHLRDTRTPSSSNRCEMAWYLLESLNVLPVGADIVSVSGEAVHIAHCEVRERQLVLL